MYSQKLHILRIVLQRPEKQATAPGLDKGAEMPPDTVCRTVRQYNKEAIPTEDMEKLQEIAEDYSKVKKYVYQRFGGIGSLWKLYPGYTVQNEMTGSGLRAELGLPSVYFYLAVFDALGDIKGQWTRTKSKILKLIGQNENLTEEEKHYLRFLLKVNNAFTAVLNQQPIKEVRLPREIQKKYEALAAQADTEMLHRYLCRQVRKYHTLPYYSFSGDAGKNEREQKRQAVGFSIAERAYRYGDNGREKGIYISTKESRKRIFVPLTDSNQYKSQLQVQLFPEEKRLEIRAAVNVTVKLHPDYTNQVGLAFGMFTMLTTQEGHHYGEELGRYQTEYAEWMRKQTQSYSRNRQDNPGRKKYQAQKNRLEEQMHGYINHELNRLLQTEKPKVIYLVKMPKPQAGGINRKINHSVAMWHRGYIRKRLEQKCREQSVEIVEVLGKDISNECSRCGALGSRATGTFTCRACGHSAEEKTNTAGNVLKRGLAGKIVN